MWNAVAGFSELSGCFPYHSDHYLHPCSCLVLVVVAQRAVTKVGNDTVLFLMSGSCMVRMRSWGVDDVPSRVGRISASLSCVLYFLASNVIALSPRVWHCVLHVTRCDRVWIQSPPWAHHPIAFLSQGTLRYLKELCDCRVFISGLASPGHSLSGFCCKELCYCRCVNMCHGNWAYGVIMVSTRP